MSTSVTDISGGAMRRDCQLLTTRTLNVSLAPDRIDDSFNIAEFITSGGASAVKEPGHLESAA